MRCRNGQERKVRWGLQSEQTLCREKSGGTLRCLRVLARRIRVPEGELRVEHEFMVKQAVPEGRKKGKAGLCGDLRKHLRVKEGGQADGNRKVR